MMKKTLLTLALITASLSAQAATQLEIDQALAPVKNSADLQVMLNSPSALDALEAHLPEFLNSVKFPKKGLQPKFDKELLETHLSATEIYKILSLFGQQTHIGQYQDAAIISDTDRLLLSGSTLPHCDAASPINLSVTLDNNKQAQFTYAQRGTFCDGNVVLTENTTVTYRLVNREKSPKGLRLVGAGFANPFDGHIDIVTVSADGKTIQLQNNIQNTGVSKFQFIFTSDENDLLLLSPDPEIKNRPQN
jgi:hypothetical protein